MSKRRRVVDDNAAPVTGFTLRGFDAEDRAEWSSTAQELMNYMEFRASREGHECGLTQGFFPRVPR
jgi:hypothetical protein